MIRRGPRPANQFVMVSNAALEDERLTWRARGVLAYLLSRPEGWSTSAERLAGLSPKGAEGRDAMRSVLAELESAGYVRRQKSQDARGRWSTSMVVYDFPQPPDLAEPPAKVSAEPPILEEAEPARTAAQPPDLESSKNGGSPGVGGPAVGSPAVGKPGPSNKTETKTENKKKIEDPPISSPGDTALQKLMRWPGPEYLKLAGSRWEWLNNVDRMWELTQKYAEDVQAKGWNYSPDGWLKFMENEDLERSKRIKGRAYSPDGVPL